MASITLNGKIALISGAGSGIGLALAHAMGDKGATIVGTDIDSARVESMVQALKKKGVKAYGYKVDHSDLSAVETLAQNIKSELGAVDILCCNAGVGHGGKMGSIPLEEWKWVMDINFWGVVYMLQLFVPEMIARKQGSILITASGAGLFQGADMAPYNASKAAVLAISNTLRIELKQHNINVTALCPGIINTNIIEDGKMGGHEAREKAKEIYKTKGTPPSVVAKDAVRALERDIGIMATPFHVWPLYLLWRFKPELLTRLGQFLYKRGQSFVGPVV